MKKIILWLALVSLGVMSMAQTGKVSIRLTQIQSEKGGQISAGLFDSRESFPKIGQGKYTRLVKVEANEMEIQFEQVPVGTYALAVFQDIDGNEKLKTNFIGYPQEPLGFSNNVRLRFGPPAFSDAAIVVKENQLTQLTVQLKNY